MNAATLEAALNSLITEAVYGVTTSGQTYVSDRQRTDGNTVEVQFQRGRTEDAQATGWGIPSRLHRYTVRLRTNASTRADHARMWGEITVRLHGRRAPLVTGLEVTTVGDVQYEHDGVGDTSSPLSSWAEVTFKGDVLAAEMAANG